MDYFLSCDWGTSAFRLRLVRTHDLAILAEEKSDHGIAVTFKDWEKISSQPESNREHFYLAVIAAHVAKLQSAQERTLNGMPVVLSGMASSSIGIAEMPYHNLPFSVSGKDLSTRWIKANAVLAHDVLLISGVCSDDDVMRGEETQLIGCIADEQDIENEQLFIFPGTHSKHILIKNKRVVSFTTYMTGEFFALLSAKSILSASVVGGHQGNIASFKKGVLASLQANLLHASFLVRTNVLFSRLSPDENYGYLSGLLIGNELKGLISTDLPIVLCCGANLKKYYDAAIETLLPGIPVSSHAAEWVESSVVRGQLKLLLTKINMQS